MDEALTRPLNIGDLIGDPFPEIDDRQRKSLRALKRDEALTEILQRIVNGIESLKSACEYVGVPVNIVMGIFSREPWKAKYMIACRERAALLAEQSIEIADCVPEIDEHIKKAELRIKTRQWFAGRLDPDRWEAKRADVNAGPAMIVNIQSSIMPTLTAAPAGDVIEGELVNARR